MKISVCGAGVIGSGVVRPTRDRRMERLEKTRRRIRRHLQRRETPDRPGVVGDVTIVEDCDAVFAAMPYNHKG